MRLLLEGPAIEPLLERVRTEHGQDARIVHAERVRTGGVGGFFSREHFEVTVEVPAAVPARSVLSGIDALVAAAEQQERADDPAAPLSTAPTLVTATPPTALPVHGTTPETAEMTTPGTPAPTAWVFPQVAAARTAPPTDVLPGEVIGEVAVAEVVPGPHRAVSTESTEFADLLRRLEVENARPLPLPPQQVPLAEPVAEEPVVAEPAQQTRRGRRARQQGPDLLARLAALGVPAHLTAGLDAASADLAGVAARLQTALAGILAPAPALADPGCVVLVVGEPARAGAAAAALATRHRLGSDAVLDLGGTGVAPTADQVRRELARLRGGDRGAVVVLGTDPVADPADDAWLSAVARSLGADHVLACVDATRKVADLTAWLAGLERLGLSVEALDVHHVRATSDPASVLGLGVPVLTLDGGPADSCAWTSLLLERLIRPDGPR